MSWSAPALLRYTRAAAADIDAGSPADELMPDAADRWVRCVDIAAPPGLVYRWLCQLTVAPYSFDWIDNLGRRSPPTLTPGAYDLTIGQPFLIFAITGFLPGVWIAGRSRPEFRRAYGDIAVSYQALPREGGACRLRANACLAPTIHPVMRLALAAGDRLMAGRQLRNLKKLAEGGSMR